MRIELWPRCDLQRQPRKEQLSLYGLIELEHGHYYDDGHEHDTDDQLAKTDDKVETNFFLFETV